MFYDEFCYWCKQKGVAPTRAAVDCGLSESAPYSWRVRHLSPRIDVQIRLAKYFDISIEQLNDHTAGLADEISKEQLKFALFRGDEHISDEMLQEVLSFAEFVKQRENSKRNS